MNPVFDALLFALTTIRFDNVWRALDAGPGSAEEPVIAAGARIDDDEGQYEGIGLPPRSTPLTDKEILGAQMAHPATRQFIDHLNTPEEDRMPLEDAKACRELEYLFVEEGILCRRVPGKSDRAVVIPPVLHRHVCLDCHDRCGHHGVFKVTHRVESRFYWEPSAMRTDIRDHLRHCRVCVMTNLPRHKAGKHHSIPTGEWPFDVTSGDTADTALKRADGSKIEVVSFGCNLSRGVLSEVPPRPPTSPKSSLSRSSRRQFASSECPASSFQTPGLSTFRRLFDSWPSCSASRSGPQRRTNKGQWALWNAGILR